MDGARGLEGWQWLFIIEGAGSFLAALVALVLLPDYVDSETGSGKWLFSEKERDIAARRIAMDRVSVPESDRSVWNGLFLAVKDYRTWVFVSVILSATHQEANLRVTGPPPLLQPHGIRLQQFLPNHNGRV